MLAKSVTSTPSEALWADPAREIEKALASSKDENISISRALVKQFVASMQAGNEAGEALADERRAVTGGRINERLAATMVEFINKVLRPPIMVSVSRQGVEAIIKDAISRSKAALPASSSLPADGTLEVAMISILERLREQVSAR